MSKPIHSNAFIDMLEEVLQIDLSACYKVVITADITEPLDIALHIDMRGNVKVIDGFRVFAELEPIEGNMRIYHDE
jgi:hypothetical protein